MSKFKNNKETATFRKAVLVVAMKELAFVILDL